MKIVFLMFELQVIKKNILLGTSLVYLAVLSPVKYKIKTTIKTFREDTIHKHYIYCFTLWIILNQTFIMKNIIIMCI